MVGSAEAGPGIGIVSCCVCVGARCHASVFCESIMHSYSLSCLSGPVYSSESLRGVSILFQCPVRAMLFFGYNPDSQIGVVSILNGH